VIGGLEHHVLAVADIGAGQAAMAVDQAVGSRNYLRSGRDRRLSREGDAAKAPLSIGRRGQHPDARSVYGRRWGDD
jgi:hypothetical protein